MNTAAKIQGIYHVLRNAYFFTVHYFVGGANTSYEIRDSKESSTGKSIIINCKHHG